MNEDVVVSLSTDAFAIALKLGLPILAVGLIVGLAVSVFQAVTQIQEMTLSFIPKILACGLVLMVAGPWMLEEMLTYTTELWGGIPEMARSGE